MSVSRIKLLNNGWGGIEVNATEIMHQGNFNIIDEVKRRRPLPVSDDIRKKVESLKYFYLNLTRHWMTPFNKYFDMTTYSVIDPKEGETPTPSYEMMKTLLNSTEITDIAVSASGFIISGKLEVISGKKIAITTPNVTEEDDVSFFLDAMDKINYIMEAVNGMIYSPKALEFDARTAAKHAQIKEAFDDEQSTEDIMKLFVDKLAGRGLVYIQDGPYSEPKKVEQDNNNPHTNTTLHTNTSSIDSLNVADVIVHNEEPEPEPEPEPGTTDDSHIGNAEPDDSNAGMEPTEDQIILEKDKKDIGKGTLTSNKKFPKLGDETEDFNKEIPDDGTLESFEFSENLGQDGPRSENLTETWED